MINRKIKLMTLMMVLISVISAQTISVQGVLRDPLGKTVEDGYYSLTLKLYEELEGGIEVWQESQSSVYTIHGVFSLDLGSVNSLDNVPFNTTYYLGISVDGDPEMDPRLKLLKVPSTLSVVGTQNIIPSSGNVGIGTMNPQAGLHIVADGEGDDLLKIENEAGKVITADLAGDLYLESGGVLKFEDGSQLKSADFGGTVASVVTDGDAIITADADRNGAGRIKFYTGDTLQMVIGHSGVAIAGKTNFGLPTGSTIVFTGEEIPEGWLLCDGSEYSTTDYSDLYNVIGTSFGSAGADTFNVPDLRTKHVMGYDSSNEKFDAMGETGGEETHTLTIDEVSAHNHSMNPPSVSVGATGNHTHEFQPYVVTHDTEDPYDENGDGWGNVWHGYDTWTDGGAFIPRTLLMSSEGNHNHTATLPSGNTGTNTSDEVAVNILHPYLAVNYIIKY